MGLAAGRHRLEIVRGGGNLKPGNGQDEVYDTVFVAPDVPVRLVSMPPSLARSLCGRHLDWIEVTTPTGQAGSGGAAPLPAGETPCPDLGAVAVDERVLIGPRPGTFYSVDALNPDVVRRGSSYYMFFSGNRARTDVGQWRTGLAVAKSPEGPFVVDPRAAAPQLNGGTIVRDRAFVQGYDRRGKRVPLFGRSRAGRTWQRFEALPAGGPGEWNYFPSDIGLQPLAGGFRAYFAGRPGRSGADLGAVDYRDGRWASSPRQVLTRVEGTWDGRDLGQPSVFEANGREYMLYGGLAADGQPRQIGVAVRDKGQWRRCGDRPFIAAGPAWYSQNAIDPEPEVVGDRLYVYFGGGADRASGGTCPARSACAYTACRICFPEGCNASGGRAALAERTDGQMSTRNPTQSEATRTFVPAQVKSAVRKVSVRMSRFRRPQYRADGMTLLDRNTAFLDEPRFRSAYDTGMASGHRINGGGDLGIEWRVHVACWSASHALRIEGDFVECGVNTGMMSLAICQYVDQPHRALLLVVRHLSRHPRRAGRLRGRAGTRTHSQRGQLLRLLRVDEAELRAIPARQPDPGNGA